MDPQILTAWQQALDFWGSTPQLNLPADVQDLEDADNDAIAYISMDTRQVVYNSKWFQDGNAMDCLPAVFAHELAHHLHFPHSLKVSAELHLLAETLIPGLPFSYMNIFWDLLVNQAVGEDPEFRRQLIKVYDTAIRFPNGTRRPTPPLFAHYLFVYEVLWNIEGHFELPLNKKWMDVLRGFAQDFYQLENFHDQFLHF